MERRRFLCLLGVAPVVPVLEALAPLAPPDPDTLTIEGNQIKLGKLNVFRVEKVADDKHVQIIIGEPWPGPTLGGPW